MKDKTCYVRYFYLLPVLFFLTNTHSLFAQTTYEGFGSATSGGTGQAVVHVTNLNATGTGSLHAAMGSNRTIVFDVGGTIIFRWDSSEEFPVYNLTIDGSSAPSPGITLNNNDNGNCMSFQNGCHDIIVKNIRVRNAGNDGFSVVNAHDIIFDHCSSSGNRDGGLDITAGAYNITVQWCIFGPVTSPSSGPMLIAYKPTKNISIHHNLFNSRGAATQGARNPLVHSLNEAPDVDVMMADIRNNVVWNWGNSANSPPCCGYGHGTALDYNATANIINNYYQTDGSEAAAAIGYNKDGSGSLGYVSGNVSGNTGINPNSLSNHALWTIPAAGIVTTQDACTAAALVLANAGCRYIGVSLDATDQALINEVSLPNCPAVVSVKAFLQGAYNSGLGRHKDVTSGWAAILNANALNQPYNVAAFGNYAGTESVSNGFFTSNSGSTTDIVDWVLLEIKNSSSVLVARRAAFIREDGKIVDLDGTSPVSFVGLTSDNYYITLRHRNHLGISTENLIAVGTVPPTGYTFDFSTETDANIYGTSAAYKIVGANNVMVGGNANSNNNVRFQNVGNDPASILLYLNNITSASVSNVYNSNDVNMDGIVRWQNVNNDPAWLLNNALNNVTSISIAEQKR